MNRKELNKRFGLYEKNNYRTLETKILNWADEKGLIEKENISKQTLKVVEEVGELCSGICKNNNELIIDSLGDILVTLIILSGQMELDLTNCLGVAFNEIKDRKGKMINGSFVKSEDL